MDNFRRRPQDINQPTRRFSRGADGRLRLSDSGGGHDIGDIWAEQKRIRLAEAIEADRLKAEKQKRRASKEFVLNVSLPKVRLPKMSKLRLPRITKYKRNLLVVAGLVIVGGALGTAAFNLLPAKMGGGKGVLDANNGSQTPNYSTILPEGKSVDQLGGWFRVSPPGEDPAYAYADTLNGITINVTQQPLPEDFKSDPQGKLIKLAEQFGATRELSTPDGTKFFVGVSEQGPESTLLIKNELLILIKSQTAVDDNRWIEYISHLK